MVQKRLAVAPGNKWGLAPFILKASLSSAYLRDCFVASLLATPAQPFSWFFHHTALAKLGNPTQSDRDEVLSYGMP